MSARIPCAFRVFPDGDVIALFPTLVDHRHMIESYMHVGQHGSASRRLLQELRVATLEEARLLRRELESKPYNYRIKYADTPD